MARVEAPNYSSVIHDDDDGMGELNLLELTQKQLKRKIKERNLSAGMTLLCVTSTGLGLFEKALDMQTGRIRTEDLFAGGDRLTDKNILLGLVSLTSAISAGVTIYDNIIVARTRRSLDSLTKELKQSGFEKI